LLGGGGYGALLRENGCINLLSRPKDKNLKSDFLPDVSRAHLVFPSVLWQPWQMKKAFGLIPAVTQQRIPTYFQLTACDSRRGRGKGLRLLLNYMTFDLTHITFCWVKNDTVPVLCCCLVNGWAHDLGFLNSYRPSFSLQAPWALSDSCIITSQERRTNNLLIYIFFFFF
jgi:hypothetical protein